MAGIPLHITPLSYIRGSGSQYITTDFYLRSTDTIKSKWRFEGQAGNTYGCYTSGGADDNFCLYAGSQSANAYIRYNGQVVRDFKPPTGTIHELEQGPDGFFDNGVKLVDFDPATFTCSAPMYIFMLPNSTSAKVTARCYGLTIFRDGEQVCNFIPARNELTGEVGFYEYVGGVFYENAGTGAFTAGPEVNFSVKTLLLKRRRALLGAAKHYETLPSGLIRMTYVESLVGTSVVVKTGVIASDNIEFEIDAMTFDRIGSNDYGCLFGGRFSSNSSDLQLTTYALNLSQHGTFRRGGSRQYAANIIPRQRFKASLSGAVYSIDGYSVTTEAKIIKGREIFLFALNDNGTATQNGHLRVYGFKLLANNVLLAEYIPCYNSNTGIYGFYDKVSNSFVGPYSGSLSGFNESGKVFENNAFSWGAGGIIGPGQSSGSINQVMSMIGLPFAYSGNGVRLEAANGYEIRGIAISNNDQGANWTYSEYDPVGQQGYTIPAGKYYQISISKIDGTNANLADGPSSLKIATL